MEETKEHDTKIDESVASKSDTFQLPIDFTKHLLGEALALAGVTVVAYLLAYIYELSYCYALDIPPSCIEIGTMQMIQALLATAITFFVIFTAVLPFSMKINTHLMGPIVALCLLAVPLVAPSVVSLPYTPFVIVAVTTLLFPWGRSGDRTALLGQLLMMLLIIFILSGVLGEYLAKTQTTYLVQRDMPEWVVLRRYGDVLVMRKVDGTKLTNEIRFEKYAEGGLTFKSTTIGPLVPQSGRRQSP